jgi:large subunit ribosomal protein L15
MKRQKIFSHDTAQHKSRLDLRCNGAGQGKTAGRGTKGQKARSGGTIRRGFQGGQNPIQQQLPYKRGFTNIFRVEYNIVNLSQLDAFEADSEVTVETLFERRMARRKQWPVKVLGEGELTKALTVRAHKFSKSAREKIEAAGGRVEVLDAEDEQADAAAAEAATEA